MNIVTLIPFLNENRNDIKIHFACGGNRPEEALNAFLEGHFKEWQERQKNKNFECLYVLSLIRLNNMEWLFGGVYRIDGVRKTREGGYKYRTVVVNDGEELIGRMIIHYHRQFRQSYCWLKTSINDLEILEIKRSKYELPFPGYENVNISWEELNIVIDTNPWKTALSNQKGVYLITDTSNGKRYVGSASGSEMLWGRWKSYVNNGHGSNKELKQLKFDHIKKCFRYSILDVYKSTTDDTIILEREAWWKEVLLTRGKYGYNCN